jgi:ABC-2 type transport system ATP-binding protein
MFLIFYRSLDQIYRSCKKTSIKPHSPLYCHQKKNTGFKGGFMSQKNSIATKDLTKIYGVKTAVDSLNISVRENELFALLGVNGAGKTTTIRMLSCLSSPTSGTAEVLGHDVQKEPEVVKSLIGISTQDTAVAENLTV